MRWEVRLTAKACKNLAKLPQGIVELLQLLLADIEFAGPGRNNWPGFGKLSHKDCYHCHLKKGKPTYVAVWKVNKKERTVEVTYVGTHERAKCGRLC